MQNPWKDFTNRSPEQYFVFKGDRSAVEAHARKPSVEGKPEYTIHTELLPTPFIGDPSAPVVLLSRNPAFDAKDAQDYAEPEFRKAAIQNLTHEVRGLPFFTIDPRFRHTASYRWWRSKLRSLIEDKGIETVARGVFCVQAFPYHSADGFPGVIPRLASQKYTNELLAISLERGALVLGMIAKTHWEKEVPQLRSYNNVHWPRSWRTGTVSSGNFDCYHTLLAVLSRSALKHIDH